MPLFPLLRRTLTAVVGIPLVLGWLWVSSYYQRPELVVLLLGTVTGIAVREYAGLLRNMGVAVPSSLLVGLCVGFIAAVGLLGREHNLPLYLMGAALLAVLAWAVVRPPDSAAEGFRAAAAAALGLVYIPFLLQFFYPLLGDERGFARAVGLLALVWAYDTGAYLAGSRWGRHKLAPRLSPGKTWEGVLGGLLLGFVAAILNVLWLMPKPSGTAVVGHALGLSVLVGGAAQLGDLFESLLKRAAGVKDSGGLFPGHGGMLDRIDALLFALPVYTLYTAYLLP